MRVLRKITFTYKPLYFILVLGHVHDPWIIYLYVNLKTIGSRQYGL